MHAKGQMLETLGVYSMCVSNTAAAVPFFFFSLHFGGKMFKVGFSQ